MGSPMDLSSGTHLWAVLHSAGPTRPGSVTLPLPQLYLTECVAALKSVKYLWNKLLQLRGKKDGTNSSSGMISAKCNGITKSWEGAADVGSCSSCWAMFRAADVPLPWDLEKWLLICTPLCHWKLLCCKWYPTKQNVRQTKRNPSEEMKRPWRENRLVNSWEISDNLCP